VKFRLVAAALLLVVVATALAAWWWQPSTLRIDDASKPVEVTLHPRHQMGNVLALHVEGRGRIKGEAEISLILNGQPYKTEKLSGSVRFSWQGDWHAPVAVVRYTPLTATSGALRLQYRFSGK
jgi:hypothetical protein